MPIPLPSPAPPADDGQLSSAPRAARSRSDVLDYIDGHVDDVVGSLGRLVRIPSVSGSDEENSIQADLATEMGRLGLDVDHWPIPLRAILGAADFPGVEVHRDEAWGLVGVARGRVAGPRSWSNSTSTSYRPGTPPGGAVATLSVAPCPVAPCTGAAPAT